MTKKIPITVRLPEHLERIVVERAEREHRTLASALIALLLDWQPAKTKR